MRKDKMYVYYVDHDKQEQYIFDICYPEGGLVGTRYEELLGRPLPKHCRFRTSREPVHNWLRY